MDLRIIYTIIIGSVSGILGGALGFGGSFIMLPGLLLLGVTDFKTSVGTVLLSLLPPISLLAVIEYYKKKQVDTPVGIILFVSYFLFAFLGAKINAQFSSKILKLATSIIFFIIGGYYFFSYYQDPPIKIKK